MALRVFHLPMGQRTLGAIGSISISHIDSLSVFDNRRMFGTSKKIGAQSKIGSQSLRDRVARSIEGDSSRSTQCSSRNSVKDTKSAEDFITDPKYVLGIACGTNTVGYALLHFRGMKPIKFGVIDLEGLSDVHERASEVVGVLNILRETQLQRDAGTIDKSLSSERGRWAVAMLDHCRVPKDGNDILSLMNAQKLDGIVSHDASRLFGYDVIPKRRMSYTFRSSSEMRLLQEAQFFIVCHFAECRH